MQESLLQFAAKFAGFSSRDALRLLQFVLQVGYLFLLSWGENKVRRNQELEKINYLHAHHDPVVHFD